MAKTTKVVDFRQVADSKIILKALSSAVRNAWSDLNGAEEFMQEGDNKCRRIDYLHNYKGNLVTALTIQCGIAQDLGIVIEKYIVDLALGNNPFNEADEGSN